MEKMYMTDHEILESWKNAVDRKDQVKVLAELNACGVWPMMQKLASLNAEGLDMRWYKNLNPNRKTPEKETETIKVDPNAWTEKRLNWDTARELIDERIDEKLAEGRTLDVGQRDMINLLITEYYEAVNESREAGFVRWYADATMAAIRMLINKRRQKKDE